MQTTNHPLADRVIGAPTNWDEALHGPCDALHVMVAKIDNMRMLCSFWKPTPEELAELNAGGSVMVGLCTLEHPVITVRTTPAAT